ncbi:hypothetical protein CDL15_Pgr027128 [Punica granatum]|uniref:Uncharacterized protein n=1 Tax=Punica granatum TaxID=22663 RepID=A0A218X5A0_PUNGR|nr:hypothetical protein CDL15_Pgr027128 [Punica granatum]PKI58135.1 hypothetical protein CRG98_021465 [Punica granatum]
MIGVAYRLTCDRGARLMITLCAVVKALICRRLVSLLGRLLVHWRCPGLAMKDSSSGVERLRTPRNRESGSAVVLAACNTYDPGIISKSWGY